MKIGQGSDTQHIDEEEQSELMPFGKYRGTPINELNPNYIQVLLEKCDWMDDKLKDKLKDEFLRQAKELPCFQKLYTPNSTQCARCPFLEICATDEDGDIVYWGDGEEHV